MNLKQIFVHLFLSVGYALDLDKLYKQFISNDERYTLLFKLDKHWLHTIKKHR